MDGSCERNEEKAVQTSDSKMTRSNRDRLNPRLLRRTDLMIQPMPAMATPITLAATE